MLDRINVSNLTTQYIPKIYDSKKKDLSQLSTLFSLLIKPNIFQKCKNNCSKKYKTWLVLHGKKKNNLDIMRILTRLLMGLQNT